jgi:glycosyltransferase involved in cell wall biosynthesis
MAYRVTVLICTRNRGDAILTQIKGVLANSYADFDLLIVDQSTDSQTARAIGTLESDPRLRYIHTDTQGLSTARNIGLAFSHNDLVLMTDDDCEVPPNWIAEMVAPFLCHPRVGVVFCDVIAGPHDPQAGFIPNSLSARPLLIEDLAHWQTCDGVNLGIGAGMAIRRSAAEAINGFDTRFGPGGQFCNSDDLDFALRSSAANYQICRINHVSVTHHGFRTFEEGRRLMHKSMFSTGAVYGRLIRRGHWQGLLYYAMVVINMVLTPAVIDLLQGRRPPVLGRAIWLARGLIEGLLIA